MNCSCLGGCESESRLTFDLFLDGLEHSDELDTEEVPPYEDRLGPDGWVQQSGSSWAAWYFIVKYFSAEGENPDLPQQGSGNMTKSDEDDDQYDDDHDEQSKFSMVPKKDWAAAVSLHL